MTDEIEVPLAIRMMRNNDYRRMGRQDFFMGHYVCACCWGDLGHDVDDPKNYFCLKGPDRCSGRGFVTRWYADMRRGQSTMELFEVKHNYPGLDGKPIPRRLNEAEILKSLGF